MVDGVIDRPLILSVLVVKASTEVDQLLYRLDMALSRSIVDASLPILVLAVD